MFNLLQTKFLLAAADCNVLVGTPGLDLDCTNTSPVYALMAFIINKAILLLGGLAVLAIIIAGIQYITSQGNPEQIKTAKSRLINAVIGLILLALTGVIMRFLGVAG